jgi:hypothetical protein
MGGVGMLSVSVILPYLGQIYGHHLHQAVGVHSIGVLKNAVTGTPDAFLWSQAKYYAGTHTLRWVAVLPMVLVIAFTSLHFAKKKKQFAFIN